MSRSKSFNQVSFHPRAKTIPHPDALRQHGMGNRNWAEKATDDELTAEYLIKRTIGGADAMNPFKNKPNRSSAYSSYLDNEAQMIRQNPAYRPTTSASELHKAALDDITHVHEDNECRYCGNVIPEEDGYCRGPNC